MSGLKDFLTPYSHLLFANRNPVIVLLAVVLGWTVIQLLVARWRTERLERDLVAARAGQSTSPLTRPRHAPAQLAEEPAGEAGSLPPIKGGRSYARNLGSALQKAGIPAAGPQLYSPPVPQGWNPNTGNGQPGAAQPPMQPPTYAPPPAPWGAPPAAPAPWAYPAGANRPQYPGQPMGPAPSPYAPQPPAPFAGNQGQLQPGPYPMAAPSPFPQPFAPPSAGSQTGRPSNDAAALAAPSQPMPAIAAQPQMQPAVPSAPDSDEEESNVKEGRRRGKPKRRRFSLSVLDNLEKIVQPRASEQAPVASPAPAANLTPPTLFEQPEAEAQLTLEPAVETESVATEPEAAAEPELPIAEPEAPAAVEPPRSSRPDMRSMLFGEEPEADAEPVPAADGPELSEQPEAAEETHAAVSWDSSATSDPWRQTEAVADQTPEPEPEPVAEHEPEPEGEAQVEAPVETPAEVEAEAPAEVVVAEPEETAPVEAVHESPEEPATETGAATSGSGTVVIIEDDKAAADYYATLFRGNGYQVDVANDGVSGVDLCTRVQPHVILLDVMMPRQNGILVLQTLRASDETKNTPVVVMSNFSEPTLIKRALQLGALEYVIKTQVEGPALLSAIPHWMNREKAFAA